MPVNLTTIRFEKVVCGMLFEGKRAKQVMKRAFKRQTTLDRIRKIYTPTSVQKRRFIFHLLLTVAITIIIIHKHQSYNNMILFAFTTISIFASPKSPSNTQQIHHPITYLCVKIVLMSSKSLIGRAQVMGVAKRNILLRFR